jgi:hypothetical protein
MGVEHAELQVEYWLAGNCETEVSWLDNAGMHGSHRDLKDAFSQGGTVDMALALEGRKHAIDREVFPHWMNVGPVIMQRNSSRVGVPFELDAEPILDFAFLPVQRRQFSGKGRKHRLVRIDSRRDDKVSGITRELQSVVIQEATFGSTPIFGEDGSDSRFPLFAQNRDSGAAVRIPKGQVDFLIASGMDRFYLVAETKREVIEEREHRGAHCTSLTIRAALCTSR